MRLDGPGVGSLPLPAGSLGQIRPVSGSEQQILFSHLCKMSYFYLLSGGGWAKPWSPGCCLAPLPRREGVRCPPAPYGILLKQGWRERARQGGEACGATLPVLWTNKSLRFLVLSIWHLS